MIAGILRRRGAYPLAGTMLALISATSAYADTSDDYVACLIGRAAVSLHKQERKDRSQAVETAYRRCKEPKGVSENELEGISDYVNQMVEAVTTGT